MSTSIVRCGTTPENVDVEFCSSGSIAATCATERRCSVSKEQLKVFFGQGSACDHDDRQAGFLPGNDV